MPLPFILAGAAVLAGGYGVKKGLDAKEDMEKAENLNSKAKNLANNAERRIKDSRSSTNKSIENFGKTKISIMSTTMKDFFDSFSRIKNVNLNDSIGLDELRDFNPNSKEFIDMKNASFKASELAAGGLGGIAAGALTAAGAYGVQSELWQQQVQVQQ